MVADERAVAQAAGPAAEPPPGATPPGGPVTGALPRTLPGTPKSSRALSDAQPELNVRLMQCIEHDVI